MKLMELLSAGLIVVLIVLIGHPLWKSFNIDWVIWGLGIGLMGIAGALRYFKRYGFLQMLLGLWGWTWFALFFFEVFPTFSISLI